MKYSYIGGDPLISELLDSGKKLISICDPLLPFEQYFMAALMRGIDTVQAYSALTEIDNFLGCATLTRLQLDSIARSHAVMLQEEPHGLADRILRSGVVLRKVKDKNGHLLTDRHVIELLAENNPWVSKAYEALNESVHLSPLHLRVMLAQSQEEGDEKILQYIPGSPYVSPRDKEAVNKWFGTISKTFITICKYWARVRANHADTLKWQAMARSDGFV